LIDIKILRRNPEVVKTHLKKRFAEGKIQWVDRILKDDERRRALLVEIDNLRHQRNLITSEIAKLKSSGLPTENKMEEAKRIPIKIKRLEGEADKYEANIRDQLARIPNFPHESVPVGEDENDNVKIKVWGSKPLFKFKPKDHIDLGLDLNLMDVERAAKVSGARFYYLKNETVYLEFALIRYALDVVTKEGFIPIIPPVMVRREAMFGAGFLPEGEGDIYWIKGKDLCLSGTAEIPLAAMHMNEILNENELPLYYTGFSTCFRTEAGAHGRDTKGIFRVHQFDKLELFIYTIPEKSWEEHEKLLSTVEKIYQGLDLHYRVVNVCSGELGTSAAKKYDLELWLPGQGKFREVVSCSNCTDYQARRLNTRCRKNPNEKPRLVHTLNSTAVAIGRTLVGILEDYQQEDGSIRIPDVLKRYLDFDLIEKKGQ